MKRINIETGKFENDFQQFRKACLEVVDEDIEICYNNNILKHNFDYKNKVLKTYKYHTTKHEGAISKIEAEIFDIYSVMTKGGINTRVGTDEVFNMAHDFKVEYSEGDNMMKIGMDNIVVKTAGRNLFTTTYQVECPVCGKKNWSSVKSGFVAKCHRCANKEHQAPQISMNDLVDQSSLINRNPEDRREITFFNENDFKIKLILDRQQSIMLDKVQAGVSLGQGIKNLFAMSNKDIDKDKVEAPRPVSVPSATPKKTSTTRKAKSKITDEDLTFVLHQIRSNFANKSFKSRDLAPKVAERLTARQLPNRLTQLVNKGILNADTSSPKNYTLIKEV